MTWSRRLLPAAAALAAAGSAAAAALLAAGGGSSAPTGQIVVAVAVAVHAGMGLLIALARPGHRIGHVLLGGAAAWGLGEGALALAVQGLVTGPGSVPAADWLAMAGLLLRGVGWLVLVLLVPLLFPDGRLPSPPWRWAALPAVATLVGYGATTLLAPVLLDERLAGVGNPLRPPSSLAGPVQALAVLTLVLMVVTLGLAVGGLVGRWRSGTPVLRQQLLWLTGAAAVPVLLVPAMVAGVGGVAMFGVAVLPVPVAIGVAVLQHRLYDFQPVVNRTVAWVALSAALAVVYVLAIAGVGALLDARGAGWLPWLATGAVALCVLPLRDALQRGANRLTYGQWAQPEAVLAAVRRRSADAGNVTGLLQDLVRELGEGLGLARIAVLDADGRPLAAYGSGDGADQETALTAYGRPVGVLRWSRPRRTLRRSDRRLLDDIAAHLGSLVHAAGLLSGLRTAHERLLLAREDERRRLRRDLHDGLGSALAGLTFRVEAARNLLRSDPGAADAALEQLRTGIQAALLDVRRVVDGLRPPHLDDLELAGALRALAEQVAPELEGGIDVAVPDDLPPVSAAAEAEVYRAVQEALTNVVRHAGARHCRLSVALDGGTLVVEVRDDGCGRVIHRPGGAGLRSMAERAEGLGGELCIDSRPGRGTTVRLLLPATVTAACPPAAPGGAAPGDAAPGDLVSAVGP